jgi:hypothetical protein
MQTHLAGTWLAARGIGKHTVSFEDKFSWIKSRKLYASLTKMLPA